VLQSSISNVAQLPQRVSQAHRKTEVLLPTPNYNERTATHLFHLCATQPSDACNGRANLQGKVRDIHLAKNGFEASGKHCAIYGEGAKLQSYTCIPHVMQVQNKPTCSSAGPRLLRVEH